LLHVYNKQAEIDAGDRRCRRSKVSQAASVPPAWAPDLLQEIHEIEERKNSHINELMKKHERAFAGVWCAGLGLIHLQAAVILLVQFHAGPLTIWGHYVL
jgi:hypothetical protein